MFVGYEMLMKKGMTILSVAHRPELKKYHQRLLQHVSTDKWQTVKL
jgi:ABC-type uncharacterized transport system fused permease/ATPase subunit